MLNGKKLRLGNGMLPWQELASLERDMLIIVPPVAFAACALGRTFTVSFACRAEHRVMNNCMKLHATAEEHDAAREEWFAMRMERHRQRERKAKMAVAQEEFLREWWGLPEEVRESKRRELERMGQAERVGGMTAKERPRGPDGR
jgi:COX assembly protein 1